MGLESVSGKMYGGGGDEALCLTFPTLFSLAVQKDVMIRESWDDSFDGGWIPRFSRPFNDWEVREVVNFMKMIHPWKVVANREDKLVLKGGSPSVYSVKLLYEILNRNEVETTPFPALSVWNNMVPLKVGFFAWEASWGKVLTLDQLKKRGRPLANRCYLCEEEEETLNHLLVHCPKARMLWDLILAIVGIGWVFPFSVRQVLLAWQGTKVGKKRKKVWRAMPQCLFWAVWCERNRVVFDNETFSIYRLKNSFICSLWSWANVSSGDRDRSTLDFLTWMGYR